MCVCVGCVRVCVGCVCVCIDVDLLLFVMLLCYSIIGINNDMKHIKNLQKNTKII